MNRRTGRHPLTTDAHGARMPIQRAPGPRQDPGILAHAIIIVQG
jgi:hypothetical protein